MANMKSGRQRRTEILERRRQRARIARSASLKPWHQPDWVPEGALPADQGKLAHDNTYDCRPQFYVDQNVNCMDCGKREVWTAASQKWWYEEAKGEIASEALRCRECRRKRRLRRSQERRIHIEGLVAKYGVEESARRLRLTVEALERLRARWAE